MRQACNPAIGNSCHTRAVQSINAWRASALVLFGLVAGLGYSIWVFLMAPSPATVIAPSTQTSPPPQISAEGLRTLPLAPWPGVRFPGSEDNEPLNLARDYAFERDWHERHASYWTEALERFQGQPDIQYLEVGLFEGASFFWVLEKILTDPTSHATGIDPFIREYSQIKNYSDTFYENLELSGVGDRTTIIEGFSQVELRKLPLASYDIIYIDGSHNARDVLEDAVLSWRLLKPGGMLIFDDYELWWERPPPARPRLGIDVFHTFYGSEFTVEHFGYQVMMSRRVKG